MKTSYIFSWMMLCILLHGTDALSQPVQFTSRGVGGGGALFSPAINPANPQEYFIACDMSELFHTTDFGLSYTQVPFMEFVAGHNSRVNFTATVSLLYSISYINEVGTPVKSTDNGASWTTLPGNPDPSEEIYTLHADYNNPDRIIISDYGAIYFSDDGGNTFTQIHSALSGNGNVVAGVFFDGTSIYIGTNDGTLVSVNNGASFSAASLTGIPAGEVIWSFAGAKSGNTTRFFCLTGADADVYVGLQGSDYWDFMQGVYSCDYGSGNWTPKMTGITVGTDFPMFVAMGFSNIDIVYLGGSNSISEPIMLKTTNAGSSWNNTFSTNTNQNIVTGWSGDGGDRGWSYGECPFGIGVCATNPDYAIFGDFGFPHITSNGGTTWRQAYVDASDEHPVNTNTPAGAYYASAGLENTTCWQVEWMNANTLWSCFSDIRSIRSTDSGISWSFDYTGHTANTMYRVARHPNGNLLGATSNIHDMYQSTRLQDGILDANDAQGKILYSTDNGSSWLNLHTFNHPVFWVTIDPNNPNRAYASVIHYNNGSGTGGVYRCDDLNNLSASTWTLLSDPPRTQKHPASLQVLNDGTLIATFSGRRDNSGFTNSSGVFLYNPGANSWTDVSDPGMHYWTKDIIVDPNDASQNTWYVGVFSGWGGLPNGLGGLYKTTNRGASWSKLTGNTLDRVTSCTFRPGHPDEIYLTTEGQGLWTSTDINSTSPVFSQVSSYPFRQPERVFFNPHNADEMWVTSFGNGMKVADLNTGMGIEPVWNDARMNVYPNPATEMITWELENETENIEIRNSLGQLLYATTGTSSPFQVNTGSWPAGSYFIQSGNRTGKMVIRRE